MKIAVGTESALKLRAVKNSLDSLGISGKVISYKAKSLVSDQPIGLEEMSQGALNRATEALQKTEESEISIGIENGLLNIATINEWFDIPVVCVLTREGKKYFSIGAGYSIPDWMIKKVLEENTELGFIIQELDKDAEKDPISFFSKGAIKREEILSQAIICALNNVVNNKRYIK